MSANDSQIIYGGEFNQFYTISEQDGVKYDKDFPVEWAKTHFPYTGPIDCKNCAIYGCYKGVFVGYCCNCAQDYKHERGGLGFADGQELCADKLSSNSSSAYSTCHNRIFKDCQDNHFSDWKTRYSAANTYLMDVSYDAIGITAEVDRELYPEYKERCLREALSEFSFNASPSSTPSILSPSSTPSKIEQKEINRPIAVITKLSLSALRRMQEDEDYGYDVDPDEVDNDRRDQAFNHWRQDEMYEMDE